MIRARPAEKMDIMVVYVAHIIIVVTAVCADTGPVVTMKASDSEKFRLDYTAPRLAACGLR